TQLQMVPSLMGENDLMRAFQLLPGVQGGKEGTSGIYVRGGSPDQNLVLLDDMALYYVNHIAGFISVFNPDAIKNIDFYKGGFPARYGGRLSSIMDIRMKEGNMTDFKGSLSIGLLTSKITFEGPIMKNKTSYIISVRRSPLDLFTRSFQYFNSNGNYSAGYSLYDLNLKINHILDTKNRLYLSLYSGRDRILIKQKDFSSKPEYPFSFKSKNDLNWGNSCLSFRWNHTFSQNLFGNFTAGLTKFYYNSETDIYKIEKTTKKDIGTTFNHLNSSVNDVTAKIDFDYYQSKHQLKFGLGSIAHQFLPSTNNVSKIGEADNNINVSMNSPKLKPWEFYTYIEDKYLLTRKLSLNTGLNLSCFTIDKKSYISIQPRITGNYHITDKLSLKSAYSQMVQALHLLSNNDAGLSTDLWVPATKDLPPQNSKLFAISISGKLSQKKSIDWSIEAFYKTMNNLIEFSDGASFFSGETDWQQKVEKDGKGKVHGIELLIHKKIGKTTGWIAYTLSKNMREFENLNFGEPFPYKYDRRNDFAITFNHQLNNKIDLSASWIFESGNAITLPSTKYDLYVLEEKKNYGGIGYIYNDVHIYGKRNNYRTPSYHRLDVSINLHKELKKGTRTWTIGLYNTYSRLNPYYLYFDYDKTGNQKLYSFSLFPILPSISYNYRF
ncbi:MAG: TonB-dependent receptor plug domain-containing protein, partial [Bacteroidota bacterium]|nr:TonB-dependent receptor plug domain-containing protein [Bacteroidota bacterium]